MSLKNIRIVLVNPIYSGNIGSVCRAMKNMAVTDLRIASPKYDIDEQEARKMACHAQDIFNNIKIHESLEDAVSDCGLVAGTTARPGLYRSHSKTLNEYAHFLYRAAAQNSVALVFGQEDNGLSNENLAICTHIIQIPSSKECPSINLAHAVMLCCYELFLASQTFKSSEEPSKEASSKLREQMFSMWRQTLLDIGFMKEDKADHMMMGLRRIFARGPLTENDVKILMGISRQMEWAASTTKNSQHSPR